MKKGTLQEVIIRKTGEVREVYVPNGNAEDYTIIHNDVLVKRDTYLNERPYKAMFDTLSGGFTFTMIETLKELITDTDFTPSDKTRIMLLGTYVSYENNNRYLIYSNGTPIKKNQLMGLLEMKNRNQFYTFYNLMLEKGVFTEVVENRSTIYLIWSENYHFRGRISGGKQASSQLIKTYDNQIRELYTAKKKNGKQMHTAHSLYTFFTLLPFIHPQSNALCRHPELPVYQSQPFTLHELADLFGYNRTNDFNRVLRNIKIHDMPAVAHSLTNGKDESRIIVNPFIVNRTGTKPNATLFTIFSNSFQILADRNGWTEKQKDNFLNQGNTV